MTEIIRQQQAVLKAESKLSAFLGKRKDAEDARTPAHILCDCSRSMAGEKITRLRTVIDGLRGKHSMRLLAFGNQVAFVASLPAAGGGTPLAEALALALTDRSRRIIVLSDGEPDDASRALAEADKLKAAGVRLSAIYIGPEGGSGYDFLRRLTARCGGQMTNVDLLTNGEARQIEVKIAGLLASGGTA